MREGAKFFVIAMVLLVGCYVYIASLGGMKASGQGLQSSQAPAPGDYHAIARQDAIDNGLNPDSFERQITQESGFNPRAESLMGAEGISQIMPATAAAWNVDPWNATDSLRVAAQHMAWYTNHYGSFGKALAAYNGGPSKLDWCIANYSDWLACMPSETQNYVRAIGG